jgi:hypothetical protein
MRCGSRPSGAPSLSARALKKPQNSGVELLFPLELSCEEEYLMQTAIDLVLSTYGMMRNLSEAEAEALRPDVTAFLSKQKGLDKHRMAVEGLRYLRQR